MLGKGNRFLLLWSCVQHWEKIPFLFFLFLPLSFFPRSKAIRGRLGGREGETGEKTSGLSNYFQAGRRKEEKEKGERATETPSQDPNSGPDGVQTEVRKGTTGRITVFPIFTLSEV